MTSVTRTVEAKLNGVDWTDISADILDVSPLIVRRGIFGNSPTDRVAGIGDMRLLLNNSATNSGAKLGYYSPGHANVRSGFEIGLKVRIKFASGATTKTKLVGLATEIDPQFGIYKDRRTSVTVSDWMIIPSNYKLKTLAVQADKRPDQVLTTLKDALPIVPTSTDFDTDPDTYERSLHTERDESTSGRTVMQKLAQSSLSTIFVDGDDTLVYQSRHGRVSNTTVSATLNDTMTNLRVKRASKDVKTTIKTVTYPVEVDDGITLYTAQRELEITPGGTMEFVARYTDPSGSGRRLTGTENHVTPVADTDYKASSTSGSGNDMNGDLGITVTFGANTAKVELTNDGSSTMYINLFQLRGDGLFMYDPVEYLIEDETAQAIYGDYVLTYDMPYQDDPNKGKDFGDHLQDVYGAPKNKIEQVVFVANYNETLMGYALNVDVGDRVAIIESLTATNDEYFVNGVEYRYFNGVLTVTWALAPATGGEFWFLGIQGLSEIGETTYLGF